MRLDFTHAKLRDDVRLAIGILVKNEMVLLIDAWLAFRGDDHAIGKLHVVARGTTGADGDQGDSGKGNGFHFFEKSWCA